MILSTPKDIIRFKNSTFDVGQNNSERFKLIDVKLEPCPYHILTLMGRSKKV